MARARAGSRERGGKNLGRECKRRSKYDVRLYRGRLGRKLQERWFQLLVKGVSSWDQEVGYKKDEAVSPTKGEAGDQRY